MFQSSHLCILEGSLVNEDLNQSLEIRPQLVRSYLMQCLKNVELIEKNDSNLSKLCLTSPDPSLATLRRLALKDSAAGYSIAPIVNFVLQSIARLSSL